MDQLQLSSFALFFSVLSLLITMINNRRQKQEVRHVANLSNSIVVEGQLAKVPTALRFHGIQLKELEENGITPAELAYLINSFTVGRIYYHGSYSGSKKPFEKDTYRYKMCDSPDTRKAWPLFRHMLARSSYRDAIDATIELLNAQQEATFVQSSLSKSV